MFSNPNPWFGAAPKLPLCVANPLGCVVVVPKLVVLADPNVFVLPKLLLFPTKALLVPNGETADELNPPVAVGLDPKPFPLAVVVLAPKEKIAVVLDVKQLVVVVLFPKGITVEVVAKIVLHVPKPGV